MITKIRKSFYYQISLLFSLGFIWGTSFSIAKFAMESGITPLGYSFWQSFGPAVLILIALIIYKRSLPPLNPQHLLFYFICGLFGITLPNLTMYFASVHIPSGILGLIVNVSPILTYLFSILLSIEKFTWIRFLGIIIGWSGLMLLFLPKINYSGEFTWMCFALMAPIFLASCTLFMVKLRPKNTSSIALSGGMLMASTFISLPIILYTNNFHTILFPLSIPDLVILIEIILSSIGYILFFELLRVAGPVYYSLVGCTVAISGLFWGYFIFNEKIKYHELLSVLLIICAIVLVSKYQKNNAHQH